MSTGRQQEQHVSSHLVEWLRWRRDPFRWFWQDALPRGRPEPAWRLLLSNLRLWWRYRHFWWRLYRWHVKTYGPTDPPVGSSFGLRLVRYAPDASGKLVPAQICEFPYEPGPYNVEPIHPPDLPHGE